MTGFNCLLVKKLVLLVANTKYWQLEQAYLLTRPTCLVLYPLLALLQKCYFANRCFEQSTFHIYLWSKLNRY